jgi:uncharacterized protein involved in exopolysaccharide biosynthesis/Mrp family chromosome partitioning ATPase
MNMARNETDQILAQAARVFARRKLLVVGVTAVALIAVVVWNETRRPIYEASTTLVFDELSGPVPTFLTDASREVLSSNRSQELSSRAFAAEVVAALPEEARARFELPEEPPPGFDVDEWMTTRVQNAMTPATVRSSSVIRVIVQLPEPVLCADVANTAARVYEERSLRIRQEGVRGIREFVEEQLDRFRTQLSESEKNLRDYKQRSKISSLESTQQEVLHRLTEAEVLYNAASTERASLENRLQTIEENLAKSRADLVPSVTQASNPWMTRLQERLVDLQLQYADLQVQNYPTSHPKMVALEKDIVQTRESLGEEARKIASEENVVDPLGQLAKYGEERLELQLQVEAVRAREIALSRVIGRYEESLGSMPEKELQLARLTRERDVNQKIHNNLLEKLEETKISEAENLSSVRIVDAAEPDDSPIRPRKKVNLLLGLLVGLIGGTGIAFVRETAEGTMESFEELEAETGWPVLASIPRIQKLPAADLDFGDPEVLGGPREVRSLKRSLITILEPNGGPAEGFRMLRTNLTFRGVAQNHRTIVVTSSGPNDGKSTLVSNLAISFATMGKRVLLIDAELRRPGMHIVFNVPEGPGLGELLTVPGSATSRPQESPELEEVLAFARRNRVEGGFPAPPSLPPREARESLAFPLKQAIHRSRVENLDVLPGGLLIENPSETLSAQMPRMRTILLHAREEYDVVLLDTPPLSLVHDTAVLSGVVDGVVYVVNSRRYDSELVLRNRTVLDRAGAVVLGAVLNQVEPMGVYKDNKYYYTD